MKISKLNLRNDAHFQFHTEFSDLVKKHNPETLKVLHFRHKIIQGHSS
jgi:hypothetical protein